MSKIDTSKWEDFPIGTLFSVVKGTRLTKADMRDGEINFIGASAVNNGITAHISNDEHVHPENTITITYNGSVGEAFYQDKPFWASDDVNVLYPKFAMNRYIAFFIIPVLKKGEEYIVKLKFDYIKHNTTIAFPSVIFIKESFKAIPYTITSKNSPEVVSGEIRITDDAQNQ